MRAPQGGVLHLVDAQDDQAPLLGGQPHDVIDQPQDLAVHPVVVCARRVRCT